MQRRRLRLLACVLLVSGCEFARDELEPSRVSARGVPPTLEQLDRQFQSRSEMVRNFIEDAGFPSGTVLRPEDRGWSLVAEAGIYTVTRQCDQYLDALFRFNRNQRAGRQGLAATAGATGAILGLANAAASAIAITATAFGLAGSLFDASTGSVLFAIEPSALRNVVMQGRRSYLQALALDRITTRPAMLMAVQGYLAQCSPAAIEANINNAANGSPYAVTSRDDMERRRAVSLSAPSLTLMERAVQTTRGEVAPTPAPRPEDRPDGMLPGEGRGLTRSMVRRIQQALGVSSTSAGDLTRETRQAIAEFQLGANRRDNGDRWRETDGSLPANGHARTVLPYLSPAPPGIFASRFERAYLGNQSGGPRSQYYTRLDPIQTRLVLAMLNAPDAEIARVDGSPEGMAAGLVLLRASIQRWRADRGLPPGSALDAELVERLVPRIRPVLTLPDVQ